MARRAEASGGADGGLMWFGFATALAMDVAVHEVAAKDRWEVTWEAGQPVRGLLFTRNRNPVQAAFKVKGAQATRLDEHQVILAPRGRLASSFEAWFRTDTSFQHKDYELNVAFGDGARLLYTDHLFVVPLVCPDGAADCDDADLETLDADVHHFDLSTEPDRFVLTPSGRTAGSAQWDQRGSGVYLYFGSGEPLPDDRVHFLVDPTMPAWVYERTRQWVGPLFDHYTAQTGRELSFKPVVLLSYDAGDPGQSSYSGGGLPGQMQLQLMGGDWQVPSDALEEQFAHFLAHETFHMWNGEELQTHLDASEEWLSEGSAELFSFWALRHLGIHDDDQVAARIRGAASQCASQLRDAPLLVAHRQGSYRSFYTCGATGLAILDAQLARSETRASLPQVFQQVFATGDAYSTYDVLQAAQQLSGDPLVVAPLERLLRFGLGESPLTALADQLTGAGVPTEAIDAWTVDGVGDDVLHDGLMNTIAHCDCGGSISAWNRGAHIEFDAIEPCDQLRTGLHVSQVAGGPVLPKRDALMRAWAEIDGQGTLTLAGGDDTRVLTCEGVARPQALVPGSQPVE